MTRAHELAIDREIDKYVEWLRQQVRQIPYGEVGFSLIIHDGKLRHGRYKIEATEKPSSIEVTDFRKP